jgi:crossover junction endodeoxyribonuclease RuvC
MRIVGLDPGLAHTGWGVVDIRDNRLSHVADGVIDTDERQPLAERLAGLHRALAEVIRRFQPAEAAVEETFVNRNARTTLKLGQARGVALAVPALAGVAVAHYPPNLVKKSVVGTGHAGKEQVAMMVRVLLRGALVGRADAADALAVAICHAHHRETAARVAAFAAAAGPAAAPAGAEP